jgi:hypothetical protein
LVARAGMQELTKPPGYPGVPGLSNDDEDDGGNWFSDLVDAVVDFFDGDKAEGGYENNEIVILTQQVRDERGRPVFDVDGRPVFEQVAYQYNESRGWIEIPLPGPR